MAKENIMDALGDIAREKGLDKNRLVEVIQEAVTAAAKRKFRNFAEIEARVNEQSGELEVFRYKTVTETLTDAENQIPLDEARKLDSLAEPGDEVEYEIDNQELSRVIAQTARQMIFQKIREAERETIFENFKDRKGEVLNGIVSRTERNRIFVTFNQTEAILYRREQIPNERYASGDHIRCMLLDVLNDPKEPSQLVISRADPGLLMKLFEMEVPEIYDGIVEIVAAAREAGRRAKIAVKSHDPDVDPVGACVGMRGARVQSIISELRGEKIDIISWVDDLPTYVANAMAPAEIERIRINNETQEIDVEVEPDQLSLAIGRQGQNVRLASKLVGYKINVGSSQEQTLSLEEQIRERLLASQAELSGQATRSEAVPDNGAADGEPTTETAGVPDNGAIGGETPAAPAPAVVAPPVAEPGGEGIRPQPPVPEPGGEGIRPQPPVADPMADASPAPAVEPEMAAADGEPAPEETAPGEPQPEMETAAAEPEPAAEETAPPEPQPEMETAAAEPEPAAEETAPPEPQPEMETAAAEPEPAAEETAPPEPQPAAAGATTDPDPPGAEPAEQTGEPPEPGGG